MAELLSCAPPLVAVLVMVVCLAAVALPLALGCVRRAPPVVQTRAFRTSYLAVLGCGFLLLLSGCGTARLPAPTCPPVPADLLTPPTPPVLLQPSTPSTTPGATTSKTRSAARWTGSISSG